MENKKTDLDMAQIPYIVHKYRMYKAYKRESKLKIALIATNALWIVGAAVVLSKKKKKS